MPKTLCLPQLAAMSWALGQAEISDPEFRVLVLLIDECGPIPLDDDNRPCSTGDYTRVAYRGNLQLLADLCSKSEASVRRALVSLQHKGYLVCLPQFDAKGGSLPSLYLLSEPGAD